MRTYDNFDYHYIFYTTSNTPGYVYFIFISSTEPVYFYREGYFEQFCAKNDVTINCYHLAIKNNSTVLAFDDLFINVSFSANEIILGRDYRTYNCCYASVNVLDFYTDEFVFRWAGGSSGGNGLQNPYGEYNYSSEDTSGGEYVDSDFEDTSDGGWLSKLTNWLKAPFQKLAQLLAKIFNFFVNFIQRILSGFFDFFVTVFVPDTDDIIFDDVKETLLNKFPFIDSFRQIQNDFVNAFDNETGCPTFTITLPVFLGGSTVSPIDFRFYNQYRSWINGFIIASSYFLFIRKMYYKIPSMIRGEWLYDIYCYN